MDLEYRIAKTHAEAVRRQYERLKLRGWRSIDGTGADVTDREIRELWEELRTADAWVKQISDKRR